MHKSRLNFTQKLIFCFILCLPELGTFGPEILWAFQDNPSTPKKTKKLTRFTSRIQARPTSLYPNQHKWSAPSGVHHYLQPIHYRHLFFFSLPLQGSHGDCFVYLECGARFLNKWPDDEEDGDFTKTATATGGGGVTRRKKRRLKGVCILRLGSWH